MKNYGKLAFQRLVLVALSLLLQAGTIILLAAYAAYGYPWVRISMAALRLFFVVYLVSSRTEPVYKMAWLILIIALPVAGTVLYLTLGGNRLSRREKRKMSRVTLTMENNLQESEQTRKAVEAVSMNAARQSHYLTHHAQSPLFSGTSTRYFPCGEECWPCMLEELEKAERYIFLEYFIIQDGKMWSSILEVLTRKAAQGVDVRLIYDDFGCITKLPAGYRRRLERQGIRTRNFNPFVPIISGRLNNRDHRKLMIIDGKVGFSGGLNLTDEYVNLSSKFGYWKDAGLMLQGPGVWSMTVQFLSMWNYITDAEDDTQSYLPVWDARSAQGFVQPFCDSPLDGESVGETAILNLIAGARQTVYIMTPYLVLDDKMTTALCNAAKRGLDVRIVTPGIADKWYVYALTRSNYLALTAAGVRIFEFTPGFVHAKVFCSDATCAIVGTVNLDFRSLYLHFENGVWMYKPDCIEQIVQDFEHTFPQCREVTYRMARSVPFFTRIFRSFLQFLSPLM